MGPRRHGYPNLVSIPSHAHPLNTCNLKFLRDYTRSPSAMPDRGTGGPTGSLWYSRMGGYYRMATRACWVLRIKGPTPGLKMSMPYP